MLDQDPILSTVQFLVHLAINRVGTGDEDGPVGSYIYIPSGTPYLVPDIQVRMEGSGPGRTRSGGDQGVKREQG